MIIQTLIIKVSNWIDNLSGIWSLWKKQKKKKKNRKTNVNAKIQTLFYVPSYDIPQIFIFMLLH